MAKNTKSLLHAQHNDKALRYLDKSPDYLDWVLTMCFYSALHYVRYYLFPITVKADNAGSYKIENFDQFCRHNKHIGLSKHEILSDLVEKQCPEIAAEYGILKDLCWTARYTDYTADRTLSNHAKIQQKKIKDFCEPKEVSKAT